MNAETSPGHLRMAVVDAAGGLVGVFLVDGVAELALNIPPGGQAVEPPPEGAWNMRWVGGQWTSG